MALDFNLEFLTADNREFFIELAYKYVTAPHTIDQSWLPFFESISEDLDELVAQARQSGKYPDFPTAQEQNYSKELATKEYPIRALVKAFQDYGHLGANINPLQSTIPTLECLSLEYHGINSPSKESAQVDTTLYKTACEVQTQFKEIYCGPVGLECQLLEDKATREWLFHKMQVRPNELNKEDQLNIHQDLLNAHAFETLFSKNFRALKRFGVEGADTLIPLANTIVRMGAANDVSDIVIGGMHRGRLNFLANVMGKPTRDIVFEFKDQPDEFEMAGMQGDVPYHTGYDGSRTFGERNIHLSLTPHPSHLIAVIPVALGRARGKQEQHNGNKRHVLPLMLHTDAAFAGQGLVSELIQMSQLDGFDVGGTIHIVVNNQLGFTTNRSEGRSSRYCTDNAKFLGTPILHVNGEDPDAVCWAAQTAFEYRQMFGKDIIIDLNCYRRNGHNEFDEPRFTQPAMYRTVDEITPIHKAYTDKLLQHNVLTIEMASERETQARAAMDQAYRQAEAQIGILTSNPNFCNISTAHLVSIETGVETSRLQSLGFAMCEQPADISFHRGIKRFLNARRESIQTGENLNWATAEALAFASLSQEGYGLRLTGQDSVRGAFSQRHLKLIDQETGLEHDLFNSLESDGKKEFINSPLSEYGVVGFEYGYSLETPDCLTIWEAQFGDFLNVAQVIVDQFIICAEQKWGLNSGFVVLVPHGLEGGGPDHSSGRPERLLAACAQDNIIVANCTTPANYFHILRRQMKEPNKKPLFLLSPKNHLRRKEVKSTLSDMSVGTGFQSVLIDKLVKNDGSDVAKIILCSGRIYYDLMEHVKETAIEKDSVIVRIEQLYPFPGARVSEILAQYPTASIIWCQEEPQNLGPWFYMRDQLEILQGTENLSHRDIHYIGRLSNAAPSGGSKRVYTNEQRAICEQVFAFQELDTAPVKNGTANLIHIKKYR